MACDSGTVKRVYKSKVYCTLLNLFYRDSGVHQWYLLTCKWSVLFWLLGVQNRLRTTELDCKKVNLNHLSKQNFVYLRNFVSFLQWMRLASFPRSPSSWWSLWRHWHTKHRDLHWDDRCLCLKMRKHNSSIFFPIFIDI